MKLEEVRPHARRSIGLPRGARALAALSLVTSVACTADGPNPCADGRCVDARGSDAKADGATGPESGAEGGLLTDVPPVGETGTSLGDIREIRIEPSEVTLRSTDMTLMPTQRFSAVGVRADGAMVPLTNAVWTLGDDRVGSVSTDGVFTANGAAGGRVELGAEITAGGGSLAAVAQITVRVERVSLGGVAPETALRIVTATPATGDGAPAVKYPLDGAVMPNNVQSPDVQWEPTGTSGDIFAVRIEKPNLSLRVLSTHAGDGFAHHVTVPDAIWRLAVESDPSAPMSLAVDRYATRERQLFAGAPVRVRVTTSSISGAIYFWDLNAGAIQRVDPGSRTAVAAIANPPRRPRDGRQCVACHTVSRDGRYLSAELWDGADFSTVFDLTADPTADPAVTTFPPDRNRYLFSSFNPDASRLVTNFGFELAFIDPRAGTSVMVTAAEGFPTRAAHPDWSPRGDAIAYVGNPQGNWAVDFTAGDLSVLPVTGPDTLGAPRMLHRGASFSSHPEGGNADSHPSWSPDGTFIAFGHGTHSRSFADDRVQPGALYLVNAAAGEPVRLDRANGGTTGVDSYWPTFSPFTTPDRGTGRTYFWLAFHSRRDYGNARAGTAGRHRAQLWVTAIDVNAPAGSDPSNVPYWLAGQRTSDENMAAVWAAQPCRTNGSTCASSGECCSGLCRPDAMMPERVVCVPPPSSMCRREGQSCGGAGDCCSGLVCSGNVCISRPG